MAKMKLGELLIATGYLRKDQLQKALEEQQRWGGKLGRLLTELRMVNEDVVLKALSKQLALPIADLSNPQIPRELLVKIDGNFALSSSLCPERIDAATRTLRLAMLDPSDVKSVDEVRRRTGLKVEVSLAPREGLAAAIQKLYGIKPAATQTELSTGDFRRDSGVNKTVEETTVPQEKKAGEHGMQYFETGDFGSEAIEESLKLDLPADKPQRKKR